MKKQRVTWTDQEVRLVADETIRLRGSYPEVGDLPLIGLAQHNVLPPDRCRNTASRVSMRHVLEHIEGTPEWVQWHAVHAPKPEPKPEPEPVPAPEPVSVMVPTVVPTPSETYACIKPFLDYVEDLNKRLIDLESRLEQMESLVTAPDPELAVSNSEPVMSAKDDLDLERELERLAPAHLFQPAEAAPTAAKETNCCVIVSSHKLYNRITDRLHVGPSMKLVFVDVNTQAELPAANYVFISKHGRWCNWHWRQATSRSGVHCVEWINGQSSAVDMINKKLQSR